MFDGLALLATKIVSDGSLLSITVPTTLRISVAMVACFSLVISDCFLLSLVLEVEHLLMFSFLLAFDPIVTDRIFRCGFLSIFTCFRVAFAILTPMIIIYGDVMRTCVYPRFGC